MADPVGEPDQQRNVVAPLPIERVLRKLERCIALDGMTYHGSDLGVLAAAIVNALGLEQVGWDIRTKGESKPMLSSDPCWEGSTASPVYRLRGVQNGRSAE